MVKRKKVSRVSRKVKTTSRGIKKNIEKAEELTLASKVQYGQVRQYGNHACRYVIIGSVPPDSYDAQVKCRIEYNLECPIASQGVSQKSPVEEIVYLSFLKNATVPLGKAVVAELKDLEDRMREVSDKIVAANTDDHYAAGEEQMKLLNKLCAQYVIIQRPNLKKVIAEETKKYKKKEDLISEL